MRIEGNITRRGLVGAVAALLAGCAVGNESDGQDDAPAPLDAATLGAQEYEQITTTLFVFDTVVTLVASCSQDTLDALAERCQYFESIFSRTIPTSDIGRINAAGGAPVEVSPETADIITKALRYCEESGGRFDITIGAVSSLWDFKEGVLPDADTLAEAVRHVDYSQDRKKHV